MPPKKRVLKKKRVVNQNQAQYQNVIVNVSPSKKKVRKTTAPRHTAPQHTERPVHTFYTMQQPQAQQTQAHRGDQAAKRRSRRGRRARFQENGLRRGEPVGAHAGNRGYRAAHHRGCSLLRQAFYPAVRDVHSDRGRHRS